jgi:hypothetical protein
MADLTITAANVLPGTGARLLRGTVGDTAVTAGMAVYRGAANSLFYPTEHGVSVAEANAVGIALNNAAPGQPTTIQAAGDIDIGATVAVGEIYCVSDNQGKIAPEADVTSGNYMTILGVGTAADTIKLGILASGITVA